MTLAPPVKWFGGKFYLADWIIGMMPPHLHYVEPFAGGLQVLLRRDPDDRSLWLDPHKGVSELVNDLDCRVSNFWWVMRHEGPFGRFRRMVEATPLSRHEWGVARDHVYGIDDPVADAYAFFVLARQSRAGQLTGFTPMTRTRTRKRMNGNVSEWVGAVDGLPAVHERLRRVAVEKMDALKLIPREDTPGTLFYLDPPYHPDTRESPDAYGNFEMNDQQHRELLTLVRKCRGNVILSGRRCPLYDELLADWRRVGRRVPNHASGGRTKGREIESLWMNFQEVKR